VGEAALLGVWVCVGEALSSDLAGPWSSSSGPLQFLDASSRASSAGTRCGGLGTAGISSSSGVPPARGRTGRGGGELATMGTSKENELLGESLDSHDISCTVREAKRFDSSVEGEMGEGFSS
jgi:hypothetical protein